ncbi:MAG: tetratricopeptide repeat protein [Candidatus Omnitrophota bacterium]|jgi:hypothetical protein|nr:tetratricopeptide repeat protein [Candidatus Omnitrophota bacterium]
MKVTTMKKSSLFLILIFSIFANIVLAESPQGIYTKANLNYENENFEEAIFLYETLVEMDSASAEVFYNLGNSYFKLKRIGKAILNYERSLRMMPRDRDARLNLKLARTMTVDKIESPDKGFVLNAVFFLYDRMNINELTFLASFFYLIVITLLIFSIFFVAKRKTLFYTTGAFGITLVLVLVFLIAKIHSENFIKTSVVVVDKVDVRSGPKEDYSLQFTLHEGTTLRVVEERQSWYEIDLSKDLKGWLPKDSVEII